jgi:hypothetical protein
MVPKGVIIGHQQFPSSIRFAGKLDPKHGLSYLIHNCNQIEELMVAISLKRPLATWNGLLWQSWTQQYFIPPRTPSVL